MTSSLTGCALSILDLWARKLQCPTGVILENDPNLGKGPPYPVSPRRAGHVPFILTRTLDDDRVTTH